MIPRRHALSLKPRRLPNELQSWTTSLSWLLFQVRGSKGNIGAASREVVRRAIPLELNAKQKAALTSIRVKSNRIWNLLSELDAEIAAFNRDKKTLK